MTWIGVNQSSNWVKTQMVMRKYADQGYMVRVHRHDFGATSKEHDRYEYEVWVDFPEEEVGK